jgi:hypothetical protein
MTPEPEVHHHPHHRTGHRWVDFAVPFSALAVSVISLVVAIHHGRTMQRIRTPQDLVQALDPATKRPILSLGVVMPMVLRAGDNTLILGMKREGQEALWDKLNTARFELRFRACYCSVFDECWMSDLATVSPQRVEHCAATPDTFTYLSPRKSAP